MKRPGRLIGVVGALLSLTLLGVAGGVVAQSASRAVRAYDDPPCPVSTTTADNLLRLGLSTRDKNLSISQQLPWGMPKATKPTTSEKVMVRRDYVEDYDGDLRVPIWTAQHVQFSQLHPETFRRLNCFRSDPGLLPDQSSTTTDYLEPIFDQGHMTPNADMAISQTAVLNSFVMSNMAPQFCQFNRGVWQILESLGREWAQEHGTVYILSGSVFDRDGDGMRDPDAAAVRMTSNNGAKRVAVPSAFYKIIAFKKDDGSVATLSILMPHDQTDVEGDEARRYLSDHVVTIADIEAVTGLDLFPKAMVAPDEATSLWAIPGKMPSTLTHAPQCRATSGARLVNGTYKL